MDGRVLEAKNILERTHPVKALEYTPYRNGYIFKTNAPGLLPLYVVDMDAKKAGQLSVALDREGIFKAAQNFKPIK